MRFKKTFYIFLISFFLLNIILVYATNINASNNNYLRIHVVANSDNIDDQLLKYKVAKQVNEYISQITKNCITKEQSKMTIEKNMQDILTLCEQTIANENMHYSVKAYLGKMRYEEKQKYNISMPKGTYDSLKIVIGNGNGQNWWSLIYPTSFDNITTQDTFSDDTCYSFKLLEVLKNIFS